MNTLALQKILVGVFSVLTVCLILGYSIYHRQYFGFGLILLMPLVVLFSSKPQWLFMLMLSVFFSGIRIPYLFADFNLFTLLALLFVAIGIADKLTRKVRKEINLSQLIPLWLFILNLFIVISFRGAGFKIFGDENWGGMRYVLLLLSIFVYLNSNFVILTPKQWKRTILISFTFGLLPFLAEALFIFSAGTVTFHYIFFEFAGSTGLNIMDTLGDSGGVGRLQTGRLAGESLIMLGLAFLYPRKKYILLGCFFVLGLILISMSGHRMGIIRAFFITWFYGAVIYRKYLGRYFFVSGLLATSLILLIYLTAHFLPLSAQRMVSFLPGVNIDPIAEISAFGTTEWRLNMWYYALQEIPEYIFLGKGYTFPSDTYFNLELEGLTENVRMWAIETSAYHNGMFSLLIGMGLSGLCIGTFLLLSLIVRYFSLVLVDWSDPILYAIYLTVFCVLVVTIVFFFTLYGDVHISFPSEN
jgi:hypothetical protein